MSYCYYMFKIELLVENSFCLITVVKLSLISVLPVWLVTADGLGIYLRQQISYGHNPVFQKAFFCDSKSVLLSGFPFVKWLFLFVC